MRENENFELKAILGSMLCTVFEDQIAKIREEFFSIATKIGEILLAYGLEEDELKGKVIADTIAFILTHAMGNDIKDKE